MSRENLEVVRRFVSALNDGDVDAALALCDEAVEYLNPEGAAEPGTRRGKAEFRAALEGLQASFAEFHTAIEEIGPVGAAGVLVVVGSSGTGRISRIPFQQARSHLYTLREGRIASFRWFMDVEGAYRVAASRTENERRFREGMEAYSRGDYEAALQHFHSDIEWVPDTRVMPDATVYRGHEGVRRFWETWAEVIEGMTLEIESCDAIDDARVLAVTRAEGRGAGSGVAVGSRAFAQVAEFEDGKAVRVLLFGDVRRARTAAGLD